MWRSRVDRLFIRTIVLTRRGCHSSPTNTIMSSPSPSVPSLSDLLASECSGKCPYGEVEGAIARCSSCRLLFGQFCLDAHMATCHGKPQMLPLSSLACPCVVRGAEPVSTVNGVVVCGACVLRNQPASSSNITTSRAYANIKNMRVMRVLLSGAGKVVEDTRESLQSAKVEIKQLTAECKQLADMFREIQLEKNLLDDEIDRLLARCASLEKKLGEKEKEQAAVEEKCSRLDFIDDTD